MMGTPHASVVIPSYQRCRELERALRALSIQTCEPDQYEVLVVVDGSTDGTRAMLTEFSAPYPLRVLWQPNRGRAAACNTGIRNARGEILILLDDDMEPSPEFVAEHLRSHDGELNRGVIGAAPIQDPAVRPVTRYIAHKFNQHLARLAATGKPLSIRDFYSGNFSIRRQHLLQVGAFDEAFRIYGNEDLELAVRLQRAGIQLVFSARARAVQHNTKDFAALARDYRAKGRTSVQLVAKHPEILSQTRLATEREGSLQWRLARRVLLASSRVWPGTSQAVLRFVQGLDKRPAGPPEAVLVFALDYFYWLGVADARAGTRVSAGPSWITAPPPERL